MAAGNLIRWREAALRRHGRFPAKTRWRCRARSGSLGQFAEFIQRVAHFRCATGFQLYAHEEGPFRPCFSGLD